ncbi:MAG: pantoate--beta-alanine ligase [Terrisporobacter sp.]|uniref:pantoate--beta-alanine ligase n=1 Tax=Terrisporobacter sp. TaxID=1965305 RepID=UPI002FC73FA5
MEVLNSIEKVRYMVNMWKKEGLTVGFVPTMGYLHEGHKSLIEKAINENDKVVVSIFVNPIQFGPKEDLSNYPKDLKSDMKLCEAEGVDIIFNPENKAMYFDDFSTYIDINELGEELCGKSRPIHFRGVCTVVAKLFNIIPANKAYFGEKDAQQLAIIKRIVRDLNFDIEIIGCSIIRETDGLAKSSRNSYLSKEERKAAVILFKSLEKAKDILNNGEKNSEVIRKVIIDNIEKEILAKIDYVQVVDSLSMRVVDKIEKSILVAIAVKIGKTRLIDNFTFEV